MVSSWLSSETNKCQNPSRVEPIKFLLRSLNLNRPRLPGTLTFRDEPPGPDKSLCEIVSRISNRVDIDSKLVNESPIELIQHSTIKNYSRESCDLNSRTESAIECLSKRINNDENDSVIPTGTSGKIYKRGRLNGESLDTIKKWGSARTFAPKIGDINNDTCSIEPNSSQKKVVSTYWQNTNAAAMPINFNNELMFNSFDNGGRIYNSLDDHTSVCDGKQFTTSTCRRGFHSQLFESLENSSTQTPENREIKQHQSTCRPAVNIVKKKKYLPHDKVSQDNLSVNIDEIIDENEFKETYSENPLRRIHLSINNYFHSPCDSPLVSPKRSKLHNEPINGREKKLSKKNVLKMIEKRKSLGKISKERQQMKRISAGDRVENNDSKYKCQSSIEPEFSKLLMEGDVKNASNKELSDNKHLNNANESKRAANLNSSKNCQQVFKTCGELNPSTPTNHSMNSQRTKQSKMERMKHRLQAVLSGDHKTVAKPSEILIPQSVRGRHIFQPFADIQEHSETIRLAKDYVKKKNGHYDRNQYASKTFKASSNINPIWKPNGNARSLPIRRTTIYENDQSSKQRVDINTNASVEYSASLDNGNAAIESNVPVIRSKTFIAASRNARVTEVNDTFEMGKFNNCHSKSLRMWKELLANIDEEYMTERFVKHSNETVSTDDCSDSMIQSNNDNESQTTQKFDMTQSLQTVSEDVEHLDASTETDIDIPLHRGLSMDTGNSCDDFPSVSTDQSNQIFVDAEVSCSLPTIVSFNEVPLSNSVIKSHRMIETQTSKISFQSSSTEKKETSAETVRLQLHSKYVNTERCALIDSATGKDVREIQNFCCDTQITNTESSMFDNQSLNNLKLRMNSIESQENSLNMEIENISTNICGGPSLSTELVCSETSVIGNENGDKIKGLPDEVVKAFKIAAKRAENLHQAIEIYREHEMKKQNELNILSEEYRKERKILNLLREEKRKSQSLINALKQVSDSEKILQAGLAKLASQQEVQFTLDKLLDHVAKEVKCSRQCVKFKHSMSNENETYDVNSEWICELERSSLPSIYPTARTKILPIVYGAVCSLIFWSLQCSTSCELE